MDIIEMFVMIDDFSKKFTKKYNKLLINCGSKKRIRESKMSISEIVLVLVMYPNSKFSTFKWFYINEICGKYRSYFKHILSYNRFVELMKKGLLVLSRFIGYLIFYNKKMSLGLNFIDSTRIPVCNNKRINSHKVFESYAEIGKSTMGWFLGFKLHMIIDYKGNILGINVTAGNVDDRTPVCKMITGITGKLFGDKGYIKKELSQELLNKGINLITPMKKNMKTSGLVDMFDIIVSKKRSIIESVFNVLKNKLNLCHTRHRSIINFCVHILAVLVNYQLDPNKPSIDIQVC